MSLGSGSSTVQWKTGSLLRTHTIAFGDNNYNDALWGDEFKLANGCIVKRPLNVAACNEMLGISAYFLTIHDKFHAMEIEMRSLRTELKKCQLK